MSYGRHQSFYLKESWIPKAIKSINNSASELLNREGYIDLGIGYNMQQSLRFWIESTNIAKKSENIYQFTDFGEALLKNDIGCLSNASKILIHYFLVTHLEDKSDYANSFEWFFRKVQDKIFTKDYLDNKLVMELSGNISSNTLRRDLDCILSMYVPKNRQNPEDRNISLLADLGLVKRKDNLFIKTPLDKQRYDLNAFMFILGFQLKLGQKLDVNEQISSQYGIGNAFNLTRLEIIEILEIMNKKGYKVDITRTNNLDTIKMPKKHMMYRLENVWCKYEG